jgi:D-sedoheptulose 7-phosphate isomerase
MEAIDDVIKRNSLLETCRSSIEECKDAIIKTYHNGGKLLIGGNGGSCADAEHFVGELMKGFLQKRPLDSELCRRLEAAGGKEGMDMARALQTPLRAISLCGMPALATATANDINPDYIFAQQVLGLADAKDVFIGISTSGNAKNVRYAAIMAKALGAMAIGFTGKDGGSMNEMYDILIKSPERTTYRIQEAHLMIYHAICIEVEDALFAPIR